MRITSPSRWVLPHTLLALALLLPEIGNAQPPKIAASPSTLPQEPATTTLTAPPSSGWTALPIASYTPETELGIGAFAANFFRLGLADADSRPSSFAGVVLATTRRQLVMELIPEVYWDQDRYRLWSKLDYHYYPNSFWGVGPHTRESQREWYRESGPRLRVQLRRSVVGHMYAEAQFDTQFIHVRNLSNEGDLAERRVDGATGARVVGLGGAVGWDSRDHILSPHEGALSELSLFQFHALLGSEYNFNRFTLNLRKYFPVAADQTLALQFYSEIAAGAIPFYRLPMLGGQHLLRGYFEGRYRDRALVLTQAEYRFPLFWRVGAVGFAGFGEVAPAVHHFGFWPLKWSLGGGLRFLLAKSERLNLRADAGIGYRTWGFYVGVAEAF